MVKEGAVITEGGRGVEPNKTKVKKRGTSNIIPATLLPIVMYVCNKPFFNFTVLFRIDFIYKR
jgi:hypothetical protein